MSASHHHDPQAHPARALLLGAVAAAALAGCATANTGTGVTRAQFISRADAVCRAEMQKLRRVAAYERLPMTALAYDPRLIRQAVAIHEAADAALESLPEPPGDVAPIKGVLDARVVATTVETDTAQALAKHLTAADSVQAERLRRSALALSAAHSYGLAVCGAIE